MSNTSNISIVLSVFAILGAIFALVVITTTDPVDISKIQSDLVDIQRQQALQEANIESLVLGLNDQIDVQKNRITVLDQRIASSRYSNERIEDLDDDIDNTRDDVRDILDCAEDNDNYSDFMECLDDI